MANISDVAEAAEVSKATVSRIFNNACYVHPDIKRRVLQSAAELNYIPRFSARRDTVAIVVESAPQTRLGAYENYMINLLIQKLSQVNIRAMLLSNMEMEMVRGSMIRAVVALAYTEEIGNVLRLISRMPVIAINDRLPGCSCICSDHAQGVKLAVNHLVAHGHQQIGIISYMDAWGDRSRLEGYRNALEKNGIPFSPELIEVPLYNQMFKPVQRLLDAGITALIVCGEDLALPTRYALHQLKRSVPEDISLISFELPGVSSYVVPLCTTIAQPFDQIVDAVITQVQRFTLESAAEAVCLTLPNQLIERDTVKNLLAAPDL